MTTIRINPEILKKAQEYGINISKTCENALKIIIANIENAYTQIQNKNRRESMKTVGCHQISSIVFPNQSSGESLNKPFFSEIGYRIPSEVDWEGFEEWLKKDHRPRVSRDIVNYAKKYVELLRSGNLQKIHELSPGRRKMVLASLSNFAKYYGFYETWHDLVRQYRFRWGVNTDKQIIDRLTKASKEDVFEWVKKVKECKPEYADFMDLMAISGMRLVEAVESYNLIIKLAKEGKLSEYYKEEKETLEHFRFPKKFLRKGKKVFFSFVPKEMIQRIRGNKKLIGYHAFQAEISTAMGGGNRFSDIREAHATLLTKYLRPAEIDFIQGRIGISIFMKNYFNPALIGDLKQRVFQAIAEIKERIT